jgi:hypothetical protein
VQRLPPNFTGHDIESLAKKLISSGEAAGKSEFETTEEYQTRLKLAEDHRLLAFVLPVGDDDGDAVTFKYDADSKTMSAEIWGVLPWLLHPASADRHPRLQVAVKRRLVGSRQYSATNSFGAKALVNVKEYNEYGLALADGLISSESPSYSWVMDVPAAKEAKQHLRAALLCTRNETKIYESESQSEPTIESPREFVWHYMYLPATVQAIFIFDARSGQIIQKFGKE